MDIAEQFLAALRGNVCVDRTSAKLLHRRSPFSLSVGSELFAECPRVSYVDTSAAAGGCSRMFQGSSSSNGVVSDARPPK